MSYVQECELTIEAWQRLDELWRFGILAVPSARAMDFVFRRPQIK